MQILKILGGIVVALGLLIAIAFLGARFHDGPLAIIPGGPLMSGNMAVDPVDDWTFAADLDTIEFQLAADDTSRTTWILVEGGRAFIPCSLGFPPGKNWHLRADKDGRAIIRALGVRYQVTLNRIDDAALSTKLEAIVAEKYSGGPPSDAGVWFFALNPRTT
jgi:hypothetical protein